MQKEKSSDLDRAIALHFMLFPYLVKHPDRRTKTPIGFHINAVVGQDRQQGNIRKRIRDVNFRVDFCILSSGRSITIM